MARNYRGDLLTDRETFERYERASSPGNYNPPFAYQKEVVREYRQNLPQPAPRTTSHGQLACEYRRNDRNLSGDNRHLTGEYKEIQPHGYGQLACEYRQQSQLDDVNNKTQTTICTYLPSVTPKKKLPLGTIVAVAIAIPILIIVILFGAVWLQELGML